MAVKLLGKRKRNEHVQSELPTSRTGSVSSEDDGDAARKAFQAAFEAKFKPLDKQEKHVDQTEESDEDDDDDDDDDDDNNNSSDEAEEEATSDWSGLTDEENGVQIIEHAQPKRSTEMAAPSEKPKSFMSSKPPSLSAASRPSHRAGAAKATTTTGRAADDNDKDDASNLAHDLALQRLLKESHLLDASSPSSSSPHSSSSRGPAHQHHQPQGKSRLQALELRLQALGAKTSTLRQERMPMAHRKGIAAKSLGREARRRQEAADNGIVLERQARKTGGAGAAAPGPPKRRERGIGGPGVGRFQGGTLKLSARDVRSIQGSGPSSSRGKSSRRRGR